LNLCNLKNYTFKKFIMNPNSYLRGQEKERLSVINSWSCAVFMWKISFTYFPYKSGYDIMTLLPFPYNLLGRLFNVSPLQKILSVRLTITYK
jgi:hypothetical protein